MKHTLRRCGLLALLFTASAASAQPISYEQAVLDKPLVEGLGFEGAITVFDKTIRMFNNLGEPKKYPEYPLWYFYDTASFKLTIRGVFEANEYMVKSIRYSADKARRLKTARGARLGDPAEQIEKLYGKAEVARAGELVYPSMGVTFYLDKSAVVTAIQVYRPSVRAPTPGPAPQKPVEKPRTEPLAKPTVEPAAPRAATPADYGLDLPLPAAWTITGKPTPTHLVIASPRGVARVEVEACLDCAGSLRDMIVAFEKDHGANAVPEALRNIQTDRLERLRAESGYYGLFHGKPSQTTWLVVLRKGNRAWRLTFELKLNVPRDQSVLSALAHALAGLRLLE